MNAISLRVNNRGVWEHHPAQDIEGALAQMELWLDQGLESRAVAWVRDHLEMFNINELREVAEASCS